MGGNLLLLLPLALLLALGLARRYGSGRPQALLWLLLFAVCLVIESGQILVSGRIVSPYDVALNLSGASLC